MCSSLHKARKARQALATQASQALETLWATSDRPDPQLPESIRQDVYRLFDLRRSEVGVKALRYALLTQSVAVYVCPNIDALALQAGAPTASGRVTIDARSLCKKAVVPFERNRLSGILGRSNDPYVSKPLRRPRIEPDAPAIRNREAWNALYRVLAYVNAGSVPETPAERARAVLQTIFFLLKKHLQRHIEPPDELDDAAIPLSRLVELVQAFVEETSELGARPQYTVYALLSAFNQLSNVYGEIRLAKATEADRASDRFGDIEIYDKSGNLKLVIAVTAALTPEKLAAEVAKFHARGKPSRADLLVLASQISPNVGEEAADVVYQSLADFMRTLILAVDADIRSRFVRAVYTILREEGVIAGLQGWDELVRRYLLS